MKNKTPIQSIKAGSVSCVKVKSMTTITQKMRGRN